MATEQMLAEFENLRLALQWLTPGAQYGVVETPEGWQISWEDENIPQPTQQEIDGVIALAPWNQKPDWKNFIDQLTVPILEAINQSGMVSFLTARMTRLAMSPAEWSGEDDRLIACWNVSPPPLSAEAREELVEIAITYNIPLSIDSNNLLSVPTL